MWAVFAMIKYDFKRPVQSILVQFLLSRVLPPKAFFHPWTILLGTPFLEDFSKGTALTSCVRKYTILLIV